MGLGLTLRRQDTGGLTLQQTNKRKETPEYLGSSSEKRVRNACLPLDISQTAGEAFCAMDMEGTRKIRCRSQKRRFRRFEPSWKTRGLAKRR